MNQNHMKQIFKHYIERFEELNDKVHMEYYKWEIINEFHQKMDETLKAPSDKFSEELYKMKKLSANLIDNYTQPFHGLVRFAEKEPETVRDMFLMLYSDDNGDLAVRKQKIINFLKRSHALRDKYFPGSYLYKDDMHSVTGYLFLYDPDHNYIFKASHALAFADCIEFYDDWGSGESVKLDVYYRMCDQLVEAIKEDKELLLTDASRFSKELGHKEMHPDIEKHILAFDLIYCCSTYGLFNGISFARPKTKERQLIQERKEKALRLSDALIEARKELELLEEAIDYVNSVFEKNKNIIHKKFGTGIIKDNDGTSITVMFTNGDTKRLGTLVSVANDIISIDETEYKEKMHNYKILLKKEKSIRTSVIYAERELEPYIEYLE